MLPQSVEGLWRLQDEAAGACDIQDHDHDQYQDQDQDQDEAPPGRLDESAASSEGGMKYQILQSAHADHHPADISFSFNL